MDIKEASLFKLEGFGNPGSEQIRAPFKNTQHNSAQDFKFKSSQPFSYGQRSYRID
jgi:hypothetical protein